jgi:hypothetical protein
MKPSPFHDWLHKLRPEHVQALRVFRSVARAARPADPNYLAAALDAGNLAKWLHAGVERLRPLTPAEAEAAILAMPREFVLRTHQPGR